MIEIVSADPAWPSEFQTIGRRLRTALGDVALRIDHIGSTAVAGLAAKDIIDVQVTVASLENLAPVLAAAGFAVREGLLYDHQPSDQTLPALELEKLLVKPIAGRRANIHVRVAGRFNQRYPLLCRDYLRSHPDAGSAYAAIKRQLARYFPNDVEAYYDIKDPVFDLMMVGAADWAQQINWTPGASDC